MAPLAAALLIAAFSAEADDATGGGAAPTKQDRAAAIEASIQANTAEAKALLKQSADFLAAQEKFAFEAQTGFDVMQSNGQQLAFFESKQALMRRPDRVRVETDEADGDEHTIRFDGQRITIDLPGENAYVMVEKPGTVDTAVDYFVDDLEIPLPLHDFFTTNFFDSTQGAIVSGFYVGEVTLGKRQCHHLAFRLIDIDLQFWIEDGDRPLPCSLVITYKKARGQPQFWAEFEDWDLSPRASDGKFEFKPPDGAERLSVQAAAGEIREASEAK